ncbi:DUF3850 domain-containing protein [Klebsiella aerogenes]
MRKTHQLKIQPEFFQAVINGTKKAEFRLADRAYAVGDLLCLNEHGHCEYDQQKVGFTGAFVYVLVTHITDLSEWAPGYVMLSIQRRQMGELCG